MQFKAVKAFDEGGKRASRMVTGTTGGCSSFAIDMLAGLGRPVALKFSVLSNAA